MTKFFIDCENTMTVCAVKKLKGHTGRTFLGILHTASGAEAAFVAEGNKFHVVASGADILLSRILSGPKPSHIRLN